MGSYLRGLKSNVSGTPLAHIASLSVLAVSIIFETTNPIHIGQDAAFIALIPAILVIVYLEGRVAAIAATLLMAAVGLGARRALDAQLSAEDWTRAIFLLVSGNLIAFMFHRLRQDLRGALEVAETRLAAIDATETRYRWAFERAAMGFANTNRHGEMLQSNRRLCEMTGYGEQELVQLRLEDLVHPDDRDSVLEALGTLGNRTASSPAEVRLLRQDGTSFWARLTLSSSQPDEVSAESVFVVVDDISERRMAREALRAQKEWLDLALSAGRLGTWRIDLKDGTVTGSGKFWDIFGLPPAPSRRLEELSAVVHPADWPKLAASAKSSSAVNYDIEIRVRRSDGHVRWIALRGRQEKHGDGSWRIGVAADLTERRQTTLLRVAVKKRERVMREERHRFSNLFPVITALVNMISTPENDVAKYKEMLIDRIRTLQATHLLLSSHAGMSGMLHELVAQELQPFKETRDIKVSGPSITVPSGVAESFAMLLHELTTNSVKYGALSDPRGRVEVNWQFASDGAGDDVVFDWVESGRRKNSGVGRHGFGSMIIGVDGTPIVGHSPKLQISERGLRYSLRLSRKELEF
ncbi:PAS domain S-box protein [Mesorhizobium sp. dw_380]|uniref:PAS domain S-box protein n=1 Tax=Mesorhizobium sp. dw_380 TaxID=2812001 RepID=UPI001BDF669C|nr:PAS domain S-box protein [Mesorhizobium sp. dw_380]